MFGALAVVQLWRVVSAGYGWLVGIVAAGFAMLAWAAGAQQQVLLPIAAGVGLVAVVYSMAKLDRRAPWGKSVLEFIAAGIAVAAVVTIGTGSEISAIGLVRALLNAAFVGAVTDAMILGHWYLIDPKLPKRAIERLNLISAGSLGVAAVTVSIPPNSIVLAIGSTNGTLAWAWIATAVFAATLIYLVGRALKEPGYPAVMSATGLLYVATMVAFANVVLSGMAVA